MSTDTQEADAKSGIQVYLRIRPSNHPSSYIERDDVDVNKICFQIPRSEGAIINNSRSSYGFKFNGILDEKAKQKDVFKTIGMPVIKNALAGYNSTIFAVSNSLHSILSDICHSYLVSNIYNHHAVWANGVGKDVYDNGWPGKIRR